ncbi:unnamed protein product, partial [Candidula unifasciata]
YHRQLAWIVRGLRNAAEDRSDGACVPTPIVPLTEENETAMEDEMFLVFLRCIGISPPASQQEMFWRIPAEFSDSDLTRIADCLESSEADGIHEIVSRVFEVPSSSVIASSNKQEEKAKKREEKAKKREEKAKKREEKAKKREEKAKKREKASNVNETKRKPKSKRNAISPSREISGEPEAAVKSQSSKSSLAKAGVKKRFLDSDSDSDAKQLTVSKDRDNQTVEPSAQTTKRLRFLSSDDNSDNDNVPNH